MSYTPHTPSRTRVGPGGFVCREDLDLVGRVLAEKRRLLRVPLPDAPIREVKQ